MSYQIADWKSFLDKNDEKITEFQFRNKDRGWLPVEGSHRYDSKIQNKG